jgi:hypothetical protein
MDTIFRLIGLLGAVFTVAMTVFMLFTFRKERRITTFSPFLSMVLSVATLPIFMLLSGARLNLLLAFPIVAFGLLVGFLRGRATLLYYKEGQVMGRHSLFFLLGWGGSLALGTLLNLSGSALLASIGLLPLFLNTGTQVGINANIFLRRLVMQPSQEAAPVDLARVGLPEQGKPSTGLPETPPEWEKRE